MTDAFAELVMPVFHKVIDLQDRLVGGEGRSLDEVKRMTSGWVEETRRRSLGTPALKRSYELAMFGLVAWIDEILTDSEWGREVGSPEEILEWDLFSSRDRASVFYDHADRAEQEGDMDALETYLLAVTLGFKGELIYDDARLNDWVHRVYSLVSEAATVPERPFAEDPAPSVQLGPLRGPSLLLAVSILVAITAMTTLAAYLLAVQVEYAARHGDATSIRTAPPRGTAPPIRIAQV